MKKLYYQLLICAALFSCSSDETTETIIDDNQITTPTKAIVNVINFNEEAQPGYTVLMFEEAPDQENPLPQILLEALSDSDGKATFELNDFILDYGEGTYYFVAFTKVSNSYVWESINVGSLDISENTISTTFLYIN